MKNREKLASWVLTLEKCEQNLPGNAHPVHSENLHNMIRYFKNKLKELS